MAALSKWRRLLIPGLSKDALYVGYSDRRLYALRRRDGAILWSYATGGRVWTSPSLANGTLYFGGHDGFIRPH